jgi:sulfur-oxidizing protein SoxZ
MSDVNIKVKVPASAKKGEVLEIKSTVAHDMESGQRKDKDGKAIPRKIINKFICTYNGRTVLESDWQPAISANPYLSFFIKANESGTIEMKWTDDDGKVYSHSAPITVT